MKTPLVVMFLDRAAAHCNTAKAHSNREVRAFEAEIAEACFTNALSCRDVNFSTAQEIRLIRELWRKEVNHS